MIADRAEPGVATLPQLWRVRDMVSALAVVVIAFAVLAGLFATTVERGEGVNSAGAAAIVGFNLLLVATVLLLAARRGITLAQLGFVRPRVWGPMAIAWFGAYVILVCYVAAIALLDTLGLPVEAFKGGNTIEFDQNRVALVVVLAISTVIGAPLSEELLFRGLLHRGLRGYWRALPAMALSGALFGIFHVNLAVLVPFAAIGLLWAWAYEESGSLWTTITAHAGVNGVAFAATLIFLD